MSWDVSRVVLFSDASISCACRFSIMVFACVMLPSSFRWYPSLSIASLPNQRCSLATGCVIKCQIKKHKACDDLVTVTGPSVDLSLIF